MAEEIRDRLTDIEKMSHDRPGRALDELQELIAELNDALAEPQERAHALIRNEDLAGGAKELSENALLLQRTATLALKIREQTRRRR